ncbi:hypothetical protein MUG94_04280 [Arthrobacter gengyunqii]|uniref:Uncharacterized protein n=1 Tax=Arthrobacter gengyunqii TaxID=2886940 RepID=A0A9X1M2M2_9MICC|nr:hypothetical protein [Arthrobacter gengyunqii]MCC3269527.1 hypothetical protein [Arthrobacter gengyunqii]MCC3270988.1 hypothetical protein [Arthrobacter gengyunqii]UOY97000.1 hypothetical protein MUG94_04280 [Arthrobacter gengyunqii]
MTDNEWPREGSHAATPMQGATADTKSAKAGAAKDEAAGVAREAAGNAQHVAETAKSEAAGVASEAAASAKDLLDQARSDLTEQAGAQQQKVAEGLRSMAGELQSMADNSDQSGMATDLVRQAAERSSSVASWLDSRNPGSLVDEVKGFARQRPVAFLALAAGAGFLAGRMNKGLSAGVPDSSTAGHPAAGNRTAGTVTTPETIYPPEPPVQPTYAAAGAGDVNPGGVADDGFAGEPTVPAGLPPVSDSQLPGSGTRATDPLSGGRH